MILAAPDSMRQRVMQAVVEAGPYPQSRFHGRGLVICAGGAKILTNAYVLVRLLRGPLKCHLPIEIWHIGPREMPPLMARLLMACGCSHVDARAVMKDHPADVRDGWQLKPYALIHSAFEDVILLDADQVPLIDPAPMFDWPEYRETGAVFWPDIIDLSPDNPVWRQLELEPRRVRSIESGQLCVNKKRHWASLAVTLRLNELADVFYDLVYGDKDTFLLAWLLVEDSFALVPHPPMRDERFLGQRDFAGAIVFQHRTNCKWSLLEEPYQSDAFRLYDDCLSILADLNKVWNGRDFTPPERSAAARNLETALVARGRFLLHGGTESPVVIEFLPGHQFGAGRSSQLSNWCVCDAGEDYELSFFNSAFESFRFTRTGHGAWIGREMSGPAREVYLEPEGIDQSVVKARATAHGLTDEFIEAALRPSGDLSASGDQLLGALQLLARLEPDVSERVLQRANELSSEQPTVAQALRALAAQLPSSTPGRDTRSDKTLTILANPALYLKP